MSTATDKPLSGVQGEGFASPLVKFLRRLHLLSKETDKVTLRGTPPSLQVLTSGALSVTKLWTAAAAAGGATTFATAWAAFVGASDSVKIAAIASAGFLLGTLAVAIAIIVKADVSNRAAATSSRVNARALVAAEYLRIIGSRIDEDTDAPAKETSEDDLIASQDVGTLFHQAFMQMEQQVQDQIANAQRTR
ncbi:hypothetical protein [Streptomyces sp. SID12488]|uniref:hypothetical protein n=1 Tax=Streptomyces sp. SID12488 TaxID=2706040 RepID=UPI0013DD7149|nr:hypothetical protein [Streptomyces sp. SID12488]NEA61578.1 hypothetical protein [Streptomyces sp. SID12488]